MAETRIFNGKRFRLDTFSPRKTDADAIKKMRMKDGMKVRIVKVKNGYNIWTRKT